MKRKINIINKIKYNIKYKMLDMDVFVKIANDYDYYIKNINFIFISDQELLKINKAFLDKNYLTDIITFNLNEKNIIDADIYISIERVVDNANNNKETEVNELQRVMIHGVLHIVGEDDMDDRSRLKMREKEKYYLEN